MKAIEIIQAIAKGNKPELKKIIGVNQPAEIKEFSRFVADVEDICHHDLVLEPGANPYQFFANSNFPEAVFTDRDGNRIQYEQIIDEIKGFNCPIVWYHVATTPSRLVYVKAITIAYGNQSEVLSILNVDLLNSLLLYVKHEETEDPFSPGPTPSIMHVIDLCRKRVKTNQMALEDFKALFESKATEV